MEQQSNNIGNEQNNPVENNGGKDPKKVYNPFSNPKSDIDHSTDTGQFSDYSSKSTIDPSRFNRYMPKGVQYLPDMNRYRADQQGWMTQLGNFAVQSIGEVIGGSVSGLGSIYEIAKYGLSKEARKEADFNNWAIQLGEDIMAYSKDIAPIYRKNPNKAFDLGDFGWWAEGGVSMASTVSLLAPAMLTTKGLGWVGKVLKIVDKAGDSTKFWTQSLATAGIMRNAENFRESLAVTNEVRNEAQEVFNNMTNEEFDEYLEKNPDLKDGFFSYKGAKTKEKFADYLAARSGWMSYQINSMNFMFDLLQTTMIFKGLGKNTRTGFLGKKKVATAQSGLTKNKVKSRILKERAGAAFSTFAGAASEGVEEIVNFIGGEEGRYFGKDKLDLVDKTDFNFRLEEALGNPEAWNAGFWGMFGGLAFDKVGKLVNKKGFKQVVAGKLAEIQNRKSVIASFEEAMTDLDTKLKADVITADEYDLVKHELVKGVAYNLGVNAAANGNIDILLDHLESEDFTNTLMESSDLTADEIANTKKELTERILEAEDVYKTTYNKIYSKDYTDSTKARVVAIGTQLGLDIKEKEREIGEIDDAIVQHNASEGQLTANSVVNDQIHQRAGLNSYKKYLQRQLAAAKDDITKSLIESELKRVQTEVDGLNTVLKDQDLSEYTMDKDLSDNYLIRNVKQYQADLNKRLRTKVMSDEFIKEQEAELKKKQKEEAELELEQWKQDIINKSYTSDALTNLANQEEDSKKKKFLKDEAIKQKRKEDLLNKTREATEENKAKGNISEDAEISSEEETGQVEDIDPKVALQNEIGAQAATNFVNEVDLTMQASQDPAMQQANLKDLRDFVVKTRGENDPRVKYIDSITEPPPPTGKNVQPDDTTKTRKEVQVEKPKREGVEQEEGAKTGEEGVEGVKEEDQSRVKAVAEDSSFKETPTQPDEPVKEEVEKSDREKALDEFKDAFKGLSDAIKKTTNAGVPLTPEVIDAGIKLLKAGVKLGYTTVKEIAKFAKKTLPAFDKDMLEALKGAYAFADTTNNLPDGMEPNQQVKELKMSDLDKDTVNPIVIASYEEEGVDGKNANVLPSPLHFNLDSDEAGNFYSKDEETDAQLSAIRGLKVGDEVILKVDESNEYHNPDSSDEYAIGIYVNDVLIGHLYTIPTIENALKNSPSDKFREVLVKNLKATRKLRSTIKIGQEYKTKVTKKTAGTKAEGEWVPISEQIVGPKRLMFRDPDLGNEDSRRLISYEDDLVFDKKTDSRYYNEDDAYTKGAFYLLVQGQNDDTEFGSYEDMNNKIPLRLQVAKLNKKDSANLYDIVVKVIKLMSSGDIDFANNAALVQLREQINDITAFNNFNDFSDGTVPAPYFKIHQNYIEFLYDNGAKLARIYYNKGSDPAIQVLNVKESKNRYNSWTEFRESIEKTKEIYTFDKEGGKAARDFLLNAFATKQYNIQLSKLQDGTLSPEEVLNSGKLLTNTKTLYDSKGEPISNFVSQLKDQKSSNLVISIDTDLGVEKKVEVEAEKKPVKGKIKKVEPKFEQTVQEVDGEGLSLKERRELRKKQIEKLREDGLKTDDYDAYTLTKSSVPREPGAVLPVEERTRNWERMFGKNVPFDAAIDELFWKGEAVYGLFSEAMGRVVRGAPIGTEFHEGFHTVMHLYLDEDGRTKVYNEGRRQLSDPYLTDRQVEEALAEDFREYANTRKTGFAGFIQDIWDRLVVFIEQIRGNELPGLYRSIYQGKFNYRPPAAHVEYAKNIGYSMSYDLEATFGKHNLESYVNYLTGRVNQWLGQNREVTIAERRNDVEKDVHKKMRALLVNRMEERIQLSEHYEAAGNMAKALEYDAAAEEIAKILEHFGDDNVGIWKLVVERVNKELNYDIKNSNEVNQLESSTELSKNWDDALAYRKSSRESFDTELKRIIMSTAYVDSYAEVNEAGGIEYELKNDNTAMLPQFIDFNTFYPTLVNNMVNSVTAEEMMLRLYDLRKVHPSYLLLYERVSMNKNTMASWMSNFNKSFVRQEHLRIAYGENNDVSITQEQSNKNFKLADKLLKELNILIAKDKVSPIFTKEKKVIAEDLIAQIDEAIVSMDVNKLPNLMSDLAKSLGMTIPFELFDKLLHDETINNNQPLTFARDINKIFKHIKSDLFVRVDSNMQNITFNSKGRLTQLANYLSYYLMDTESSFYSTEGNLVYSIAETNAISNLFDKFERVRNPRTVDKDAAKEDLLKEVKEWLRDPSMKFSNWMYDGLVKKSASGKGIDNLTYEDLNLDFIEKFNAHRSDHIKNVNTGKGSSFDSLPDNDWDMESLIKYITGERGSKGFTQFSIPIVPDSGNIWFIQSPISSIYEGGQSVYNSETGIEVGSNLFAKLLNTVYQEITRMDQAFHLLFDFVDGKLVEKELTDEVRNALRKNYHYSKVDSNGNPILLENGKPTGRVFKFFNTNYTDSNGKTRSLNDIEALKVNGYLNKNLITKEDRIAIINHVKAFVDNVVEKAIEDNKSYYSFLKNAKDNKGNRLLSKFNSYTDYIAEYALNYYIFNTEYYNLIGGNITEYKNVKDAFKRNKQIISPKRPGSEMNRGASYKAISIRDVEGIAYYYNNIVESVAKVFKNNPNYQGLTYDIEKLRSKNPTDLNSLELAIYAVTKNYLFITKSDAQSLMTLNRMKNILKDYGRWPEFERLITRIEAGETINPYDYKRLLEVIKPFYYERSFDPVTGRLRSRQIKTSTVPLIPQFYKGTDLEKLVEYMEESGIDEVYFDSSYKVGSGKMGTIFDENGKLVEDFKDRVDTEIFHNSNWGIQLDVPSHIRDTENKLGVQIAKLMFNNLSNEPIYKLGKEKLTGPQLFERFSHLLQGKIVSSFNQVVKDLGFDTITDADGNTRYYINDYENLQDILKSQLEQRGYNKNTWKGLELDEYGLFNMPIFASMMSKKFESILTSIFTNNITNQKVAGSHVVIISDTVLGEITPDTQIDFDAQARERIEAGNFKLRTHTIEGDQVMEVEALMPAWSKAFYKDGERVSIDDIPEELRSFISYRIPTEAGYSFFRVKVVGFLPDEMGSSMILPSELVTQTGFDFDVDSQYNIHQVVKRNKKGELVRDDMDLDNQIYDIFTSIISNPQHYIERVNPGKFDDPQALKERQEYLSGIKVDDLNPNLKSTQNFFRSTSLSGRVLKGISANSNSFLSILQKVNAKAPGIELFQVKYEGEFDIEELKEKYDKVIEEDSGVIVHHNKFAKNNKDYTNINGDNINEHAAQMLAMILDIIKEGIPYNLNAHTFTPFISMVGVGIPISYAGMLIYQPVIQDVIRRINNADSIIDGQSINANSIVDRNYKTYLYKLLVKSGEISETDARRRGMMNNKGEWISGRKFYLTKEEISKELTERDVLGIKNKTYSESDLEANVAITNHGTLNEYKTRQNINDEDRIKFYREQIDILSKYKELEQLASELNSIAQVASTDKLGAGPSLFVTDNLKSIASELYEKENPFIVGENGNTILGEIFDTDGGYTPLQDYMQYSNINSTRMLDQLFIERSIGFRSNRSIVANKLPTKMNQSIYDLINKTIYTSLLNNNEYVQEIQKDKARIIGFEQDVNIDLNIGLEEFKKLSVANQLYIIQNTNKFSDFHILNFLSPGIDSFAIENAGFHNISFNKPKSSDNIDDYLIDSILEMFNSEDTKIRELAKGLLDYNIIVHGMQFGKDAISEYIPIEVLNSEKYLNLADFLYETMGNLATLDYSFNEDIVFQINWNNTDFVPKVNSKYQRDNNGEKILNPNGEGYSTENNTFDWDGFSKSGLLRVNKKTLLKEHFKTINASYILLSKNGESTLFKKHYFNDEKDDVYNTSESKIVYYYPISKLGNNKMKMEFGNTSIFEKNNVKLTQDYFIEKIEGTTSKVDSERNAAQRSGDIKC